jgi:hypothetical protein
MPDIIRKLDDITAQRILSVITRSRTTMVAGMVDWTADLRQALASEFNTGPATTPVTDGELARQALLLLAEDPDTRNDIETIAATPQSL